MQKMNMSVMDAWHHKLATKVIGEEIVLASSSKNSLIAAYQFEKAIWGNDERLCPWL